MKTNLQTLALKIIVTIVFLCTLLNLHAEDNLIVMTVPTDFKIKDKIILVNKSSCTILRAVVVYADTPDRHVLGTCNIVTPGSYVTLAEFTRNSLKYLRGRTIGIKVKGFKKRLLDQSTTTVGGAAGALWGPSFIAGSSHVDIKADDINNIKDEDVTYEFSASIHEANHDLYIHIYDNFDGAGALNF